VASLTPRFFGVLADVRAIADGVCLGCTSSGCVGPLFVLSKWGLRWLRIRLLRADVLGAMPGKKPLLLSLIAIGLLVLRISLVILPLRRVIEKARRRAALKPSKPTLERIRAKNGTQRHQDAASKQQQ